MTVRRVVVDHVLFVVADLDAGRGLFTAALAPLGYEELYVQDDCVSYGAEDLDDFTICRGEPVTRAAHVAFSAEGRDAVDEFFGAAVANGATVRGEPGVWTQYSERYYAAFVNDLHQNNVEAVWHAPEPVVDAPRRPGVPDSYGPRYMRERSRTRPCCRSGPIPTLGVAPEGGGDGPASEPELPGDRRGAAFARSYLPLNRMTECHSTNRPLRFRPPHISSCS